MNALNEMKELRALLESEEDINSHGGPNTAMHVRMILAEVIPLVAELADAAQRVLDKEWEYGEEQPHCVRLNSAIASVRGEA